MLVLPKCKTKWIFIVIAQIAEWWEPEISWKNLSSSKLISAKLTILHTCIDQTFLEDPWIFIQKYLESVRTSCFNLNNLEFIIKNCLITENWGINMEFNDEQILIDYLDKNPRNLLDLNNKFGYEDKRFCSYFFCWLTKSLWYVLFLILADRVLPLRQSKAFYKVGFLEGILGDFQEKPNLQHV